MVKTDLKNNNPLNIRYSPIISDYPGQTGIKDGYLTFATMELGFRAGIELLCHYQRKGFDTIRKIVVQLVTGSEKEIDTYIDYVCRDFGSFYNLTLDDGYNPDERITEFGDLAEIAWSIFKREFGEELQDSTKCRDSFFRAESSASPESLKYLGITGPDALMKRYIYPNLRK